jgi:hypothetical protein
MSKLTLLSAVVGSTLLAAMPISVRLSSTATPSLSIDEATARVGRPWTPVSVAGVNRRQNRRGGTYGYGVGIVGAGVAAAAIGTTAAVSTTPSYVREGYYSAGAYGAHASDPALATPAPGTFCVPGTIVRMLDSEMYLCQ